MCVCVCVCVCRNEGEDSSTADSASQISPAHPWSTRVGLWAPSVPGHWLVECRPSASCPWPSGGRSSVHVQPHPLLVSLGSVPSSFPPTMHPRLSLRRVIAPALGSLHLMRKQKRGAGLFCLESQIRTELKGISVVPCPHFIPGKLRPRRVLPLTQIHTVDLRQEFRSLDPC